MSELQVPVRADFAGGWLDVPAYTLPGGFIVNCTITPFVTASNWPYAFGGGIGGSAAKAVLDGKDPFEEESRIAGWQDAAVIVETGLCVWRSGPQPVLDMKANPDWLIGCMAIRWTGKTHVTKEIAGRPRSYRRIARAAEQARAAVLKKSVVELGIAVDQSYVVQLEEGMSPVKLVPGAIAAKYLGAGHGGYVLYLFEGEAARRSYLASDFEAKPIEPYMRSHGFPHANPGILYGPEG